MKKITLLMLIACTITMQGQNKLLSSTQEYYDGSNWQKINATNYEYNTNNNLTVETNYSWDFLNNKWKNSYKYSYTYNLSNKAVEELDQNWNETTNQFENSWKTTHTYTNGMITEQLYSKWTNSQWVNDEKFTISYTNNLPSSSTTYNWAGSQWVLKDRSTVIYNANNRIIGFLTEDWINSQWVNSSRSSYTYNSNNKMITEIYEEWMVNLWNQVDKIENEFDVTGNRVRQILTYGNSISKDEYVYNTSNLMSNYVHPFNDKTGLDNITADFPYVNQIIRVNSFNYNVTTSSFENSSRITYDYNNAIILDKEVFEISTKNLSISPNPSNNYIQVSGIETSENYKMYSASGVEVFKGTISDNEKIDIKNLANGLYFLQFNKGRAAKIIKQ
ncbi:T9SS type A sorting domain-containing protein [Flavobacterium cellulosilyticum]|uniref:T9SS type A sorting domain-containing protein n=1 Tax=Flavobacterium cellulosilyticum TaxID=2541731 RepID=A0A4R5CJY5_9FLAO|nr:T9SS type A sorting domain-containing protein [Flavobacterium cellulosilyticum]TDD99466.1 T9SS type A sorting domain-containing protein [Flavobacterium cellulosilyticum]